MDDIQSLTSRALNQLDEGNYSQARQILWDVATMAPPTEFILGYLLSAWKREQRLLIQTLEKIYPNSLAILKTLAVIETSNFAPMGTTILCTNLLNNRDMEAEDEIEIRWLRFKAVVRTSSRISSKWYEEPFLEDFLKLWKFSGKLGISVTDRHLVPYSRRLLLDALGEMRWPGAIVMLQSLTGEEWLPNNVKQFLEAKIRELQLLEEIHEIYD